MRQGHVPPHGKHGGQNMKDERGWAYYSTSIKQTRRPRPYQWSWKSVIIGIFWWTLMKLTAGMPIPLFFTASSSNGTPTLCCAHPSPFLPWGTALWTGACPHPQVTSEAALLLCCSCPDRSLHGFSLADASDCHHFHRCLHSEQALHSSPFRLVFCCSFWMIQECNWQPMMI